MLIMIPLLFMHEKDPKHCHRSGNSDVLMGEMKSILYGVDESELDPEAYLQLTKEFFKDNTLQVEKLKAFLGVEQPLLYHGREMKNAEKSGALGVTNGDVVMMILNASTSRARVRSTI
ncbi:uncharacterized protein LOC111397430 isoform X2 [Olea europaea var. sylvestris]|uniref:uncharacterized protein LOC111397430 isoform X2 n=1 Tax=Olea europaea var. sylvestris TaxID=158386 RepID=UPI000C1CFB32|nr:uncharacterized protein LOC111397430 isoform X2 [Olea europaea var. sylvestris]